MHLLVRKIYTRCFAVSELYLINHIVFWEGTINVESYFVCSLFHHGLLGGGLIVDEDTVTYKTGKVTVDPKYRNLELRRSDIEDVSWKRIIFPVVTFRMKNGDEYSFMIFNQKRFIKVFNQTI